MAYEFRFPDVGEGITEGEVLAWKVREGDHVVEDQTLVEVETDKAVVELPSPRAGRIKQLHAAEADIITVGDILVTIEETAGAPTGQPLAGTSAAAQPVTGAPPAVAVSPVTETPFATAAVKPIASRAAAGESTEVTPTAAVTSEAAEVTLPTRAEATVPVPAEAEETVGEPYTGSVVGQLEEASEEPPEKAMAPPTMRPPSVPTPDTEKVVLTMPSVRALAKELGVDLTKIRGTGSGGRILKQDVEDMAEAMAYGSLIFEEVPGEVAARSTSSTGEAAPSVDHVVPKAAQALEVSSVLGGSIEEDAFGPTERVAFRGIRRTMAKRMAESASKQAHVTTMDEADVSVIRRIREKEHEVAAERGVRLTYLAFVIKACTAALKRFPRLNAVLEETREEYVLKRYYNIGIAVDTKNGLVVPNIKNADQKSIFRIAEEVVDLVGRADDRRLDLQELHGGTFTITNYGAIGSTFATPIVNYPEVAILGMGRVRETPVVHEGQVTIRPMLPLSLTIDHQLIDGAEASRFLNVVIGYLEDPDLLLLEGA